MTLLTDPVAMSRARFWQTRMKWLCLALIALPRAVTLPNGDSEGATNPVPHRFKYERYDAQGGALYRSQGGNADYDDSVRPVFVDSKGWVWVGTVTGLAVYDGKQWTNRTFEIKGACLWLGAQLSVCLLSRNAGQRKSWKVLQAQYGSAAADPEYGGFVTVVVRK